MRPHFISRYFIVYFFFVLSQILMKSETNQWLKSNTNLNACYIQSRGGFRHLPFIIQFDTDLYIFFIFTFLFYLFYLFLCCIFLSIFICRQKFIFRRLKQELNLVRNKKAKINIKDKMNLFCIKCTHIISLMSKNNCRQMNNS